MSNKTTLDNNLDDVFQLNEANTGYNSPMYKFTEKLTREITEHIVKKWDLSFVRTFYNSDGSVDEAKEYTGKKLINWLVNFVIEANYERPQTWTRLDGQKYKDSGISIEMTLAKAFAMADGPEKVSGRAVFKNYKNPKTLTNPILKEVQKFLISKSKEGLKNVVGPHGSQKSCGVKIGQFYYTWRAGVVSPRYEVYGVNKFKGLVQFK